MLPHLKCHGVADGDQVGKRIDLSRSSYNKLGHGATVAVYDNRDDFTCHDDGGYSEAGTWGHRASESQIESFYSNPVSRFRAYRKQMAREASERKKKAIGFRSALVCTKASTFGKNDGSDKRRYDVKVKAVSGVYTDDTLPSPMDAGLRSHAAGYVEQGKTLSRIASGHGADMSTKGGSGKMIGAHHRPTSEARTIGSPPHLSSQASASVVSVKGGVSDLTSTTGVLTQYRERNGASSSRKSWRPPSENIILEKDLEHQEFHTAAIDNQRREVPFMMIAPTNPSVVRSAWVPEEETKAKKENAFKNHDPPPPPAIYTPPVGLEAALQSPRSDHLVSGEDYPVRTTDYARITTMVHRPSSGSFFDVALYGMISSATQLVYCGHANYLLENGIRHEGMNQKPLLEERTIKHRQPKQKRPNNHKPSQGPPQNAGNRPKLSRTMPPVPQVTAAKDVPVLVHTQGNGSNIASGNISTKEPSTSKYVRNATDPKHTVVNEWVTGEDLPKRARKDERRETRAESSSLRLPVIQDVNLSVNKRNTSRPLSSEDNGLQSSNDSTSDDDDSSTTTESSGDDGSGVAQSLEGTVVTLSFDQHSSVDVLVAPSDVTESDTSDDESDEESQKEPRGFFAHLF